MAPSEKLSGQTDIEQTFVADAVRAATPAGYGLGAIYHYPRGNRTSYLVVARYPSLDTDNPKTKTFLQFSHVQGKVSTGAPLSPLPLYNLCGLVSRPDDPVLVVEGEKTQAATAKVFPDYVVVTSPGSTGGVGKVDWTPLHQRRV